LNLHCSFRPVPSSQQADLSLCAWESLKVLLQEAVPENENRGWLF
jgi:hypothetical protein